MVLGHFEQGHYWAWHDLALMHCEVVKHKEDQEARDQTQQHRHIVASVDAFCKSPTVPTPEAASKLHDILRLLPLWFNYCYLAAGFESWTSCRWIRGHVHSQALVFALGMSSAQSADSEQQQSSTTKA